MGKGVLRPQSGPRGPQRGIPGPRTALLGRGRPSQAAIGLLRPHLHGGARILALTGGSQAPGEIAALLTRLGFGPSRLTVLEALGGPRQRIRHTLAQDFAEGFAPDLAGNGAIADIAPLNLVAIQTVHFAMTPLQLLLIIPFVRLGEHLARADRGPLSMRAGMDLFASGTTHALAVLRDAMLHAVIGWMLLGPLMIYVLYRALAPLLERLAQRLRAPGASAIDQDAA